MSTDKTAFVNRATQLSSYWGIPLLSTCSWLIYLLSTDGAAQHLITDEMVHYSFFRRAIQLLSTNIQEYCSSKQRKCTQLLSTDRANQPLSIGTGIFLSLSLSLFVRSQSKRKTRQHEVFKGKPGSVNNKSGYVFIISLPILHNGSHSSSVPYCLTQQKMHFWNEVWQHWSWSGDATFKVCFAHWYDHSRCRCTSLRVL